MYKFGLRKSFKTGLFLFFSGLSLVLGRFKEIRTLTLDYYIYLRRFRHRISRDNNYY